MNKIQRLVCAVSAAAVAVNAHYGQQTQMMSLHQTSNDDGLKEFALDLPLDQPF